MAKAIESCLVNFRKYAVARRNKSALSINFILFLLFL